MSPWLLVIAGLVAYKYFKSRAGTNTGVTDASSALNPKTFVVVLNTTCVISGIIYMVTLNHATRFAAMASSICASVLVIITNYGLPKISRASIRQPLQEYLGKCMSGAEFSFLFFSLMFLNDTTSQVLGVFPLGACDFVSLILVVRRSLWFLGSHGSTSWRENPVWLRFFGPLWARLNNHTPFILEFTSLTEVLMGFWLILLVLTPARQLLVCFVYWNFLRIRYLAPRSRASHVAAWSKVNAKTQPLRQSLPLLEKPVGFVQRWFNQVA